MANKRFILRRREIVNATYYYDAKYCTKHTFHSGAGVMSYEQRTKSFFHISQTIWHWFRNSCHNFFSLRICSCTNVLFKIYLSFEKKNQGKNEKKFFFWQRVMLAITILVIIPYWNRFLPFVCYATSLLLVHLFSSFLLLECVDLQIYVEIIVVKDEAHKCTYEQRGC